MAHAIVLHPAAGHGLKAPCALKPKALWLVFSRRKVRGSLSVLTKLPTPSTSFRENKSAQSSPDASFSVIGLVGKGERGPVREMLRLCRLSMHAAQRAPRTTKVLRRRVRVM